jgi:hypothetical protein
MNLKPHLTRNLIKSSEASISLSDSLRTEPLECAVIEVIDSNLVLVEFTGFRGHSLPRIEMSVFGYAAVRFPIKAGDTGIAQPMAKNFGTEIKHSAQKGNLSELMFFPKILTLFSEVTPDFFTVMCQIADLSFNTTPSAIQKSAIDFLGKINELCALLNVPPLTEKSLPCKKND